MDERSAAMSEWITSLRIAAARHIGPMFWPAWYVAPEWKRNQWHKIACELPIECCPICRQYYGIEG